MKKPTKKTVLMLLIALLLGLGYTFFVVLSNQEPDPKTTDSDTTNSGPSVITHQTPPIDNVKPREVLIEENALIHQIDGENVFTAWPEVLTGDLPKVIIYNHGSTLHVKEDFSTQFMKDLQYYGELATEKGWIFSASNAHGDNWGSNQALEDINKQIKFIADELGVVPEELDYYFIGYSMGGLPTMNYTTGYDHQPTRIVLLAPTVYIWEWNATRFGKLEGIDIKIWHGNADVNVPLSLSVNLASAAATNEQDMEHIIVEGAGHFDIDVELADQVLEYFE